MMKLVWRIVVGVVSAGAVIKGVMFFFPDEEQRAQERKTKGKTLLKSASYYAEKGVTFHEEFIVNSRGSKLFATSWLPANSPPRALIFLLHGYGVECGVFWSDTATKLAEGGYAVHGLDYEGHGFSDGLQAYIPDMNLLVDDYLQYAHTIKAKEEYAGLRSFLYAMSMGGAVALLVNRREPTSWDGAVLIAPMCKIADSMKPPALVVSVLTRLALLFPRAKLVPTKDVTDAASKDVEFRKKVKANPFTYQDKPRLATAVTLLNVSNDLEKRLHEVTIPFLLLHGADDQVTDPAISKALFEAARSEDKTFKLYPEMWHGLTEGDTDEACGRVWKDIFKWLEARSARAS